MKHSIKDILTGMLAGLIVAIPILALAAPSAYLVTREGNTPMLMSASGNELTVGTIGSNNLNVRTNDTSRWDFEGADGDLVPDTDGNVDVGSTAKRVDSVFADNVVVTGNLVSDTTGGTLKIHDGTAASACMGTATINGTTAVTVATTCATTGARIFLSRTADSTVGSAILWATNIVDDTSFDIDSSEATDDGTVNWFIIKDET